MMSNCPNHLHYTASHEWLNLDNYSVGITDHAQSLLGDIVFLELPKVGQQLTQGNSCAVVESVKAASDIYAPVTGIVVAVNEEVLANPEKINEDAYANWLFKVETTQTTALLSAIEYLNHIGA